MNTVLLRRSSLGDVVLLGAVTGALPGPVTVVTAPEYTSVAARLRGVTEVIPWSREVPPRLPAGRVIDVQGSLRSFWLAPTAKRVHKRTIARRLRTWGAPVPPRSSVAALYAEACGVAPMAPPWIEVRGARDRWVIAPGASVATKRWSVEGFRTVIASLDGPVSVVGGPGDAEVCASVARGTGAEVCIEAGFDETIDRFGRARAVLANDSGLLHLAAACGAPVVGVFGPTHPDDGFFPYAAWGCGEVVDTALDCRPCSLHGREICPRGHHRCMDAAMSARVIEALRRCAG